LHVHRGLQVRLQLRFPELVNFFDEMANIAKKYNGFTTAQFLNVKLRQAF